MYATPEAAQGAPMSTLEKPPASWWLATTIGVSVFNALALWGILAALSNPDPLLVCVAGVLALEYVGYRWWGDRRGLGRGWAFAGPVIAAAVCLVVGAVVSLIGIVLFTVLCGGECSFS